MPTADLLTRGFAATDIELGVGLVQPPRYRVYLRNELYQIVDELDNWLRLELVLRFNTIGSWSLTIANDELNVASIILQRAFGIVVRRDDVTIFSGSVTQLTRTATTVEASGEDDMALLRALALPSPLTSPPYTEEYNVVTAQASAVMENLVNNNIGPAARAERRVTGLTLAADPALGSTVTARARFQPLIVLLSELAISPYAGGLGFSVLQSDTVANTLEFRVWAPADRSAEAKFSIELGTAQDYEDTVTAPPGNAPFVLLGDGLGADRTVLETEDTGSIAEWGRRWETLIDRRDVSDPAEGTQALVEALAQATTSRKVAITPIDVPSLQYGTDWDLGDLVTFAAGGASFVDLIREVSISLDPERGPIVLPLMGEQGATGDDQLAVHVDTVSKRLTNVERNWNVPDDSITQAMLTTVTRPPVGQVVSYAGSSAPSGWLLCQGQAVSRTTYAALFAVLGITYGAGDGATTFALPDARGRVILGVSGSHALGTTGGAETANSEHSHASQAHTHPGSHSHAGASHTHPGSHSHGLGSHTHPIGSHTHNTDLDHDHATVLSGNVQYVGDAFGRDAGAATGTGHKHNVDPPALGSTVEESSLPSEDATGAASGNTATDSSAPAASAGTTGADSSAPAATYSGSPTAGGSAALPTMPPFIAMHAIIYAGV